MGLGEAEAREADDHRPHALGQRLVDVGPLRHRALDEAAVMDLDRLGRALAAHRPAQALGLSRREAREGHRDLDDLVLEDDRPQRVAQDGLERVVVVGDLVVGLHAQALAALDVGVDRAALDRPRAHDRHLDGEVVEVLGARAPQRAHLRAALDLEDAGGLGLLDGLEGGRVVVGDAREVDPLAPARGDELDAALDRREHPQPEQVDLQEARVRAGVLVPHDHLPPLHGGGHDRAAVDQRAGGDDHAAGVLGEVAGQAVRLLGQRAQPAPAALGLATGPQRGGDVAIDVLPVPALRAARDALDLPRRQAQRLAQLADGAARAEGREGGHERGAIAPEAVVHARDEDLAHVAREVEVDVGQRRDLLVEEAPEQQLVGDRVDVREAREVADDGGHRRPAPAPGRQQRADGVASRAPRWRRRGRARASRGAAGRSPTARAWRSGAARPPGARRPRRAASSPSGSGPRSTRGRPRPACDRPRRPRRRGSDSRGRW